jgi:CubicO group peptidase (beta-lactamase class C family)
MVIEKVTGQPYADYVKAHIFEPFGMTHSWVADYKPIIPDRSRGYEFVDGKIENARQYDVDYPFSAGAIQSTVGDMLLYQQGVFEGSKTSQAIRDRLLHARTLNDGTKAYYAQGCLITRDFEGHRKISHSGDIEGFSAHYAYYPDDGVTIVLLTNVKHVAIMPFAFERKLARVALGIPAPKIVDLPVSAAELARVSGSYDVKPFAFDTPQVSFVGKDGHLFLNYGEGVPLIRLLSQGGRKFVLEQDDEHTFTFSGERPLARTVVREFYDGTFPAVRHDGADKP